jgi:hypothetical protein
MEPLKERRTSASVEEAELNMKNVRPRQRTKVHV